jgi:hypothetical protein
MMEVTMIAWIGRFPLWQRLLTLGVGVAVLTGVSLAVWWRPLRQRGLAAEMAERPESAPRAAVIPPIDRAQPATETATLALG